VKGKVTNMFKKLISAFVIGFVLSFAALASLSAGAQEASFSGYNIPIDIKVNGSYLEDPGKGILDINGITYVPVRYVSEVLGASVEWDAFSACAIVKKGTNTLAFYPFEQNCYINNVWNPAAQQMIDGSLYANANFLFPALGAQCEWDSYKHEYCITIPNFVLPQEHTEQYYTPDDLYWLSMIVTCEAGSVTFDQRIMVTNVILNRRASSSFPNTVYDVIFDKRFGIQFSPAYNGKIYKAKPTTETILAIKAALNGVDLAPDCLYFIFASNKKGWVAKNRPLYKIVGTQAYYK